MCSNVIARERFECIDAHGRAKHRVVVRQTLHKPGEIGVLVDANARRAQRVQHAFGVRMAIDHVSSYARRRSDEMSDAEFVSKVVQPADCKL